MYELIHIKYHDGKYPSIYLHNIEHSPVVIIVRMISVVIHLPLSALSGERLH